MLAALLLVIEAISRLALPGPIPVVGSNSLAIAAACQASSANGAGNPTTGHEFNSAELYYLMPQTEASGTDDASTTGSCETDSISCQKDIGPRTKLTESEIKWGCVNMPGSWYHHIDDEDAVMVKHLSFGTKEDGVSTPKSGCWYA